MKLKQELHTTYFCFVNLVEKSHFRFLDVDEMIILNLIYKKKVLRKWTGLNCLRTRGFCGNCLTAQSLVLLGKLTVNQLVNKFPTFYEHNGQEPTIGSYNEPFESNPHPVSLISILVSFQLSVGLPSGLFSLGFPTKIMYALLVSPCMLHV